MAVSSASRNASPVRCVAVSAAKPLCSPNAATRSASSAGDTRLARPLGCWGQRTSDIGFCLIHFHSRRAVSNTDRIRFISRATVPGLTCLSLPSRQAMMSELSIAAMRRSMSGHDRSQDAIRTDSHLSPALLGASSLTYRRMASRRDLSGSFPPRNSASRSSAHFAASCFVCLVVESRTPATNTCTRHLFPDRWMLAMAASYGEFLGRVAGQVRANRGGRGNPDHPKCLISCRIGVNRGEHVGSPKHAVVPGAGIEPAWGCPRRILSPMRLPVSPSGPAARADCNGIAAAAAG